ncbi:hypothetical protein AHF37_05514 [Paragonimus kellicotti]|nr:hypothetical protein AHF37_05514 [Paragonimus kellicotti]
MTWHTRRWFGEYVHSCPFYASRGVCSSVGVLKFQVPSVLTVLFLDNIMHELSLVDCCYFLTQIRSQSVCMSHSFIPFLPVL